jgi:hypothetical protein
MKYSSISSFFLLSRIQYNIVCNNGYAEIYISKEDKNMELKIPFTVRISAEPRMKLKLISAATKKPMGSIMEELIESLWE